MLYINFFLKYSLGYSDIHHESAYQRSKLKVTRVVVDLALKRSLEADALVLPGGRTTNRPVVCRGHTTMAGARIRLLPPIVFLRYFSPGSTPACSIAISDRSAALWGFRSRAKALRYILSYIHGEKLWQDVAVLCREIFQWLVISFQSNQGKQ